MIGSANSLLTKIIQDFPNILKKPPIFGPISINIALMRIAPICVMAKRKKNGKKKRENGTHVDALPNTICNVTFTVVTNQQTYQTYPHNQFCHQPRFLNPLNITFSKGNFLDKFTQFCQECQSSCSTQTFWSSLLFIPNVCKLPTSALQ